VTRHPNSLAALKKVNATRSRTRHAQTVLAPFHTFEHMAKMTAARLAKKTRQQAREAMEREFPIVTVKETRAVVTPSAPPPRPETPRPEMPTPVMHQPVEIPKGEESEGDRRCRLYERDYALLLAGKPLPVSPPDGFTRSPKGAGRIDWSALGCL